MPTSLTVAAPSTPAEQTRLVFLDVARVAATVMMVQGHTVDALLAPTYRGTDAYHAWTWIRGLTPSTFLFMAGFAFAVVTWRPSAEGDRTRSSTLRLRRFALFLCLGYALHAPGANLVGWLTADASRWRAFWAVDILQCVAVTLTMLQVVAMATGTAQRFTSATLVIAASVPLLTPIAWSGVHGSGWLALTAYGSPATGSLFPLFPWSAYAALGAAMGGWYRLTAGPNSLTWARRVLLPGGAAMYTVALVIRALAIEPSIGGARPSQFLLQAGLVCLVLATITFALGRRWQRIASIELIARESLAIYFVHVCIVYGSPWNPGLRQLVGPTLSLPAVIVCVLIMWSTMGLLVVAWSSCKQRRPRLAMQVRWTLALALIAGLVF